MIANTPKTPYYVVIFTSIRSNIEEDYASTAQKMTDLAKKQKGFLGVESAKEEIGITVSYWESLEAIKNWKMNVVHTEARNKGRSTWYKNFKVRIAKVTRDYEF